MYSPDSIIFSLKRGKRDLRALSFELSKMSPQVGLAAPVDPKNSNFKNRKIRCRIIRFKLIFCEILNFFPKKNQTPAKDYDLEHVPLSYDILCKLFPF